MNLLLVDDEPLILDGLAKLVERSDLSRVRIRKAADAFEALEIMGEFMPDVTITDLNMPEQSGFELIANARKAMYCDRFIILTGYDEFEYARQAVRTGVLDYLLKPIDETEVLRLLRGVAEQLEASGAEAAESDCHMSRIKPYIEANYREDLSLDTLTSLTGLHPNYISGLFRKETGDTFVHYLNSLRVRKACELLVSQRRTSVNRIGQQVGFENPQHFIKVFKKETGMTPGAYREENRDDGTK
ncbi:response regulator transcription factor [Cohnella cellulosilytica]|uniref:Response regulator n=1 Tax=Cohnella cellulosilytica TaxID=986710 RepID=A0ABW2FKI8_9BACL